MKKELLQQIKDLESIIEKGNIIAISKETDPNIESVKKEYIEQEISYFEQELLNNKNHEKETLMENPEAIHELLKHGQNFLKDFNPVYRTSPPITMIAKLNDLLKFYLEQKYLNLIVNYRNSILQRNISPNAKRLTIQNFITQIINRFSELEIIHIYKAFSDQKHNSSEHQYYKSSRKGKK